MRSSWRIAALVLGVSGVLPIAVAGNAAGAAPRGWVVAGGVRFEPVGAQPHLTVGGVGSYRGAVEVRPGGAVVNDVALEDYVKGIAEVPATWPVEALKAQAIAARTYALYTMSRYETGPATSWRGNGAHICATQDCQVYAGLAKENKAPQWAAAAEATAGQVILYDGGPILAMYSSSNGGASLPGSQPYLRPVRDPDDSNASPVSHWRYALPLHTVGGVFAMPGTTFDVGRAGDRVVITSRTDDGAQHQQSHPLADFRNRVNATIPPPNDLPRAIPSLRYTVATNGDGVVIDGRGFGHGIGMSQFGALGKAMRGMKAPDILAAYYGGLRPAQLGPAHLPPTIRVEVAAGRGDTAISSGQPLRVVAGDGTTIAHRATGTWHVIPAGGGKVRVVAPAGQDAPLALEVLGINSRDGVRIRTNLPTDVQLTVDGRSMPSQLVGAGEHTLVPPPLAPGPHTITIAADAGAGRTAGAHHVLDVAHPRRTPVTDAPTTIVRALVAPVKAAVTTEVRWPVAAVAVALAALAGTGGGVFYRSRRSRSS